MNLIREGGEEGLDIIQTIIDAECDTIFLCFMEEDYFRDPATECLNKKAHPDIRFHFSQVLEGQKITVSLDTEGEDGRKSEGKLKVFAVDESKMILNIY